MPKYKNATYIEVDEGQHFGVIDIVGSILQSDYYVDSWFMHKDLLHRQFTMMALCRIETFKLSIQALHKMKLEFLEAYQKLFESSFIRLKGALKLKIEAMKICKEQMFKGESISQDSLSPLKNLTKVELSNQDKMDLKADEINYQI